MRSSSHERSDGRIRIRPYQPGDVDALYEAVRESIDAVSPWLAWCHADYSRDESAGWIASRPEAWKQGEAYSFAVVEASNGAFLGGCGLNQLNRLHRFANLGYWTRTRRAGQGVASAATRLAARFGFESLGLHRIEIVMAVENTASRRVAEKVGAAFEGRLRNRLVIGEEPRDALLFSLVPADLGL